MRKVGILRVDTEVDVAFHDVDLAQITWHGHYLKYLENARWVLMDQLGYGLQMMIDASESWPIVDLQVKYLRTTRYRDRLRVRVSLIEWDARLVLNYLITDALTGERVLRAQTTQVAVAMPSGVMRFTLPAEFTTRVQIALRHQRHSDAG
jgi:acyl-CoA thioester hydrolase